MANPPEFRVYYDPQGKILAYTMENLPGNYIICTREQFAEARFDAQVKQGKLVYTHLRSHVFKLEKSLEGQLCHKYDVSIITDQDGDHWNLVAYEIHR